MLLFDLNGFKQINDTAGHAGGDAVLTAFARVLHGSVLGSDVVGRLGGDEFAVVLHGLRSTQDAVVVAERILAGLAEPVRVGDRDVVIRTSIGISLLEAADATPAEVLHRADVAMYQAKHGSVDASSRWQVWLDEDEPAQSPR